MNSELLNDVRGFTSIKDGHYKEQFELRRDV